MRVWIQRRRASERASERERERKKEDWNKNFRMNYFFKKSKWNIKQEKEEKDDPTIDAE